MNKENHIPYLDSIPKFYSTLRIGEANNEYFSAMRLEDQPDSKLKEMPLFRSSFYRIVIIKEGSVIWNLPENAFSSQGYSIYSAYPGKLESWVTTKKVSGFLLCFTEDFLHRYSKIKSIIVEFPFFDYDSIELLRVAGAKQKAFDLILERIILESEQENLEKEKMLNHLLSEVLIELKRLYSKNESAFYTSKKSNINIYNKFRKEVDAHFINLAHENSNNQLSVKDVASSLFLNPSYLNSVIKNLTNQTASTYINNKCVLEAKSYLMHTDLQVSEIAYKLGFNTVQYFNRFFKKNTHLTPSQFRSSL